MDASLFEEYMAKILPRIRDAAANRVPVLVMDNGAYHSQLAEKVWFFSSFHKYLIQIPTRNSSKTIIAQYLMQYGVDVGNNPRKVQLQAMLDEFCESQGGRSQLKRFKTSELANSEGVWILRLPPYHCILNSIEHVWAYLKDQVCKNTSGKEKIDELRPKAKNVLEAMPIEMQQRFYNNAEHVEDKYIRKEGLAIATHILSVPIADDEHLPNDEGDLYYDSDYDVFNE